MVDLLVFIHLLVDIAFHALACPLDVPLIAFSLVHTVRLKDGFDKAGICLDHFEKHIELRLLVLARLREA